MLLLIVASRGAQIRCHRPACSHTHAPALNWYISSRTLILSLTLPYIPRRAILPSWASTHVTAALMSVRRRYRDTQGAAGAASPSMSTPDSPQIRLTVRFFASLKAVCVINDCVCVVCFVLICVSDRFSGRCGTAAGAFSDCGSAVITASGRDRHDATHCPDTQLLCERRNTHSAACIIMWRPVRNNRYAVLLKYSSVILQMWCVARDRSTATREHAAERRV